MTAPYRAAITGLGAYLPEKILTNADIEKLVETTDEWIRTRTGIRERHIAAPEQATSDLALPAAQEALKNAGITPQDLDLIIVATTSPDMIFPSASCYLQAKLGATCGAFDLAAACSGFAYALSVAEGFVKSGIYKHVLVVGAETISRFINWKDRGDLRSLRGRRGSSRCIKIERRSRDPRLISWRRWQSKRDPPDPRGRL